MVNRSQISPPISLPKRSVRDLRWWMFRLSITRWMVSASGVLHRQMEGYLRELKRRTVRRREGEVPARFGFYGAENVGCAAALVFVVAPCFPSWCSRRGWADVGMQRDWLLVQTHHRFLGIVGFFIR